MLRTFGVKSSEFEAPLRSYGEAMPRPRVELQPLRVISFSVLDGLSPMAIMFLGISDFSSRPAESSAEQLTLLVALNFFFGEMIRIAEDYGGTVEKNTGDGLMAYFEDAGGNPPEVGTKRAGRSTWHSSGQRCG